MKELLPVNQNVVIDINPKGTEQKTAGGIIIPSTSAEKPMSGKIVWMSIIDNAEIKPGDTVLFKPYSGNEIELESKKYLLLPYGELLAKIVETDQI